jgi:hypothetical protein
MANKMDGKLVSKEDHEIAYCRTIARRIIEGNQLRSVCRLARSYLKATKGYTRRKK